MSNNARPNMVKLLDVVNALLIREGDVAGKNRAQYMAVAKDVYRALELHGVKDTKRVILSIDKRTGTVTLPDDYLFFSTIYIIGKTGKLVPLIHNGDISEEVIDLSVRKSCDCDCGCSGEICRNISNYEAFERTVEMPMPDGSAGCFLETTKKKINKDGSYIQEVTTPVMKYEGGIHVDTVMETSVTELCSLEINDCGCVKDSISNLKAVQLHCQFESLEHDCGCPTLVCDNERELKYNFSDDGHRIVFPSSFPFANVVLRYYADFKTKDIWVPYVVKRLLMLLIKEEIATFSDSKMPLWIRRDLDNSIAKEKASYLSVISRMTLSEIYRVLNPKRRMV